MCFLFLFYFFSHYVFIVVKYVHILLLWKVVCKEKGLGTNADKSLTDFECEAHMCCKETVIFSSMHVIWS